MLKNVLLEWVLVTGMMSYGKKSSVILVSGLERDDGGLGRDSHRSQRRYRRGKIGYHQGQHIFYSFFIMHWSLSSLPFPLVLMAKKQFLSSLRLRQISLECFVSG